MVVTLTDCSDSVWTRNNQHWFVYVRQWLLGSCLESLRISRFNAVGTISQTHIIHMLSEEPPEPLEYLFG